MNFVENIFVDAIRLRNDVGIGRQKTHLRLASTGTLYDDYGHSYLCGDNDFYLSLIRNKNQIVRFNDYYNATAYTSEK